MLHSRYRRARVRVLRYTLAFLCFLAALGIATLWAASSARFLHGKLGPGELDVRPEGPRWYVLSSAYRGWVGASLKRHSPWRVWIPPEDRSAWPTPPLGVELSGQEPVNLRSGFPFIAISGRFHFSTWSEVQRKRWQAFRDLGDSSVPLDLDDPRDRWVIAQRGPDVFWVPTHVRTVVYVNVCLPLWLLLVIAVGYPAWAVGSWLVRVRKQKRGQHADLCRRCEYDLTGNVSGVCPECGSKTACDGASTNRDAVAKRRR